MENPTTYDYRMYDNVWKRVSPESDPFGDISAAQTEEHCPDRITSPTNALAPSSPDTAVSPRREDSLPGAELDPCCMGSDATESINGKTTYSLGGLFKGIVGEIYID